MRRVRASTAVSTDHADSSRVRKWAAGSANKPVLVGRRVRHRRIARLLTRSMMRRTRPCDASSM